MKFTAILTGVGLLYFSAQITNAQVPQLVSHQGRVTVSGTNFDGSGQFAFALISSGTPATTYWSNDASSTGGGRPTSAVTLSVAKGLYSVSLGDPSLANMTPVPASVFNNTDARLRTWFNDGAHGWELLQPDEVVATVGYAFMAANVPAGSITADRMSQEYAIFEERAPSGTSGTNFAAGWNSRALTTTAALSGTSIAKGGGNTFTAVPGTYLIDAVCTTYDPDVNQAALFDVTVPNSAAAVVIGTTDFGRISNASGAAVTSSYVKGYFTITSGTHTFEVRHYFGSGGAPSPQPSGSGLDEIYARAHIVRVK
ncbi:MAG: hypothetical protein WCD79_16515 [Chthoniobacteraceae bacterium]